MSKKSGKKRVSVVSVNRYRRIALYINPIVLVILVVCLFLKVPTGIIIVLGVIGYGAWAAFLVMANKEDKRLHKK
ncbi:MAG: hypothetical protein FWG23_02020 [Eggerthellaceae bacterium]|jgi:lipopolysaccharide export LptBFGC system permease protein LptF|nr:hypothetical protein [Eggerthellaceae bacterium]MDR2716210.1 hypothetical protein [Coriobacteriaceae bacterium]